MKICINLRTIVFVCLILSTCLNTGCDLTGFLDMPYKTPRVIVATPKGIQSGNVTLNYNLIETDGSKAAITAMSETKSTCEKTTQGTSLVATDLNNIASSITNIDGLNALIATAAEEQSSVAEDITHNMSTIRDMVEELSNNGEATASEATNLSGANSQLKSVVGKFKLQ